MLWSLQYWSSRLQIDGQFIFHNDNSCPEWVEPKGCPKKIYSILFEAGVKNQKFKIEKMTIILVRNHEDHNYDKILFSGPYWFRPLFKRYGRFKRKNAHILETKLDPKNVTAQKSLRICFYLYVGGQFQSPNNALWGTNVY